LLKASYPITRMMSDMLYLMVRSNTDNILKLR
jgi:hypothetical protein